MVGIFESCPPSDIAFISSRALSETLFTTDWYNEEEEFTTTLPVLGALAAAGGLRNSGQHI